MRNGNETLAAVTARAGLQGGEGGRRYVPGQGEHTEHQLRTLVEGVPHLIWRSCDRGRWTWASPQWLAYTGQSQHGSHGCGWLDAVHPDDHEATLAAWDAATPHGELEVEFRLLRASDGVWVWHRTTSLPLRDATGRIVEWLGSTTEIQAYKDLQARKHARHPPQKSDNSDSIVIRRHVSRDSALACDPASHLLKDLEEENAGRIFGTFYLQQ